MPISNGHRLLLNPVQIKDKVSVFVFGFFVVFFLWALAPIWGCVGRPLVGR